MSSNVFQDRGIGFPGRFADVAGQRPARTEVTRPQGFGLFDLATGGSLLVTAGSLLVTAPAAG